MRMRGRFVVLIVSALLSSCFNVASGEKPTPGQVAHAIPGLDDAMSAQVQASAKAFNEKLALKNAKTAALNGDGAGPPAKSLARVETMPANHKINPTTTDDEFMKFAHLDANNLRSADGVKKRLKAWSASAKKSAQEEKELLLAAEQARKMMEAKPSMRSRLWTGLKWAYGIGVAVVIFIAMWAMDE